MANKLGEAYVVINGRLGPLKAALSKAKSLVTSFASFAVKQIKRAAKLMAIALAGFAIAATKFAVSFQKQMAMVSTMLDEQTMHVMPAYTNAIKEIAVAFGESTKTLAKGLYDILSASIAPAKAMKVLGISARAAVAGMTDTETAADAITTVLNAYRISADRAGEVSDKLFMTVKRGKTTFGELASSIGRAAATSAIAGLRLEELLAVYATATRAGVRPFEAMTSIQSLMRAFITPQSDAIKAAREFGFELSSTTLKTIGLAGVVQKLNGATTEQLATIVPNIRAFKSLAAALQDTAGVEKDLNLISNQYTDKTTEAYEKMAKTASFSLKRLWQQIKVIGVAFGSHFNKPLKDAADTIREFLAENEDAFDKLGTKVGTVFSNMIIKIKDFFDETATGVSTFDLMKIKIEEWGEKSGAIILFVKNQLIGLANWFRKDWKEALKTSLNSTMPLWEAFGRGIGKIFSKIADDFIAKLINAPLIAMSIKKARNEMAIQLAIKDNPSLMAKLGGKIMSASGGLIAPLQKYLDQADEKLAGINPREYTQGLYESKYAKTFPELMVEIKEDFKKAIGEIKEKLPEETTKAYDELIKKLAAITEKYEKLKVKQYKMDWGDEPPFDPGEPPPPRGARGGGAGRPAFGGGKVGFVGLKEAWKSIATKSPMVKAQEKGNDWLEKIETNTSGLAGLGTFGA